MTRLQRVRRKGRACYYQVRIGADVHYLGTDAVAARKKYDRLLADRISLGGQPDTLSEIVARWSVEHPKADQPWARARLIEWLGDRLVGELAPDLLIQFAEHLNHAKTKPRKGHTPAPLQPKTIRHCLAFASRVFRDARASGWTDVQLRNPKLPRAMLIPRDLSPADVQRLISAAPETAKPIITFLVETGARPSEACSLKWDQLDLRHRSAILATHKTGAATGQPRTIFLSDRALEVIQGQSKVGEHVFLNRRHRPFKPTSIRTVLYRLARQLSISNVTAYALRHTFLQHALDQGLPIEVVAGLAGHRGLEMIRVYARIRDQRLRQAAANLPSILPNSASREPSSTGGQRAPAGGSRRRGTGRRSPRRQGHATEA